MNLFKKIKLYLRASKRLGAFAQAKKKGYTTAEARTLSDNLYPPTKEDLEYEKKLNEKENQKKRF